MGCTSPVPLVSQRKLIMQFGAIMKHYEGEIALPYGRTTYHSSSLLIEL